MTDTFSRPVACSRGGGGDCALDGVAPHPVETRVRPVAHIPALDGLRGLAILMVLCVHFVGDAKANSGFERALVKLANYGIWGVDLFFVLSGFLITGILYDAKDKPHYFRDFFLRRMLRIFPLYYGVLAVLFVILPVLSVSYPDALRVSARHDAWLWLYGTNVYLALAGSWALPYVGHFWSLAVEEHFYLVWPFVVVAVERKSLLRVCFALAGFSLVLRCGLSLAGIDGVALVVLTPCRLDALSVGAFLAIFVRTFGVDRLSRRASGALAVLSIAVLLTSLWHASTQLLTHIVLPLRGSLVAGCFGALLVTSLGGARRTWRARLLESAGLRFLGKYSYGLYVFHGIIAYAMHDAGVYQGVTARVGSSLLALVLCASAGTGASLVLAVASYELFEKRFLRLKGWLAPSREAGDGLAAATGTT